MHLKRSAYDIDLKPGLFVNCRGNNNEQEARHPRSSEVVPFDRLYGFLLVFFSNCP